MSILRGLRSQPNTASQPNTLSSFLLAVAFLLAVTLTTGCGSDYPETLPVTGRVTVDGKPLDHGKIVFYPEKGRAAIGSIGSDGSYRLTTFEPDDGALPGKHRVTVRSTRTTQSTNPPGSFEEELGSRPGAASPLGAKAVLESLVPDKYSRRDTTPLTAEVVPGKDTFDFALQAD